jgi:DUF4097 and DUF4098 domain-containing protein YvlB
MLIALWLLGPGLAGAEVTERFEKTVPLDPGGRFRIENTNGSITLEAWDQPSVAIEAEKKARDEERLSQIEIDVESLGSSVTVKTRLPRARKGHGSVEYHVRVPVGAAVEAETVNGRLDLSGVAGTTRVSTVNGGIHLRDASGGVDASTVNGSIEARYHAVSDGVHRFSTTNGSVTLELPAGASGEVDAETTNGSISTDFPVTLSGKISRRRLKARLGEGGARYEVSTVNGSVKLLKY